MGLFELPDPVSMFESAKNAGLEREIAQAFVSASLSATICALWRQGESKFVDWTGEARAFQDAATAMYLTLTTKLDKGFLTLTVPQDLLDPNNLSRFETEFKEKQK